MNAADRHLLATVAEGYAGDNALEHWENVAEEFYRDTGFLRPGKSYPCESCVDEEEQRAAWDKWVRARAACIAAAIRTLLAETEPAA
tara:strand:+ start:880 stop:1140 length:261 start_codon:yes stop_codon:yes gene_type:complete